MWFSLSIFRIYCFYFMLFVSTCVCAFVLNIPSRHIGFPLQIRQGGTFLTFISPSLLGRDRPQTTRRGRTPPPAPPPSTASFFLSPPPLPFPSFLLCRDPGVQHRRLDAAGKKGRWAASARSSFCLPPPPPPLRKTSSSLRLPRFVSEQCGVTASS